jgi:hypothetical protein
MVAMLRAGPLGRYVLSLSMFDELNVPPPGNVPGLRFVYSPEKETENDAFPFQRRAGHR